MDIFEDGGQGSYRVDAGESLVEATGVYRSLQTTELQGIDGVGKLSCKDSYRWTCPQKGCAGTRLVRDRSFAASSHLSFKSLLVFIYCWCFGVPLTTTLGMLPLAEHTVADWYQFLRNECSWNILNDPITRCLF